MNQPLLHLKVFISHSWKNKTAAQRIADELKAAGLDLWVDAANLLPGQPIQETIDTALKDVDVIILVWSKEASESDGVAAEIYTASSLKKMIIPCHLDNTSLSTHPYLQQIKGIYFNDFNSAIGRLKMTLYNYVARDFDLHSSDTVKAMNEFMGSLETANHLIHKEDIKNKGSEEEKEFWAKKIETVEASAFDKMKEEERVAKENTAFLNEIMKRLQPNLSNKAEVGKILADMKAWKHAERPDMKKITEQVEAIYKSFEETDKDDVIAKYRMEIKEKLASSMDQLKSYFGSLTNFLFAAAYDNMQYFYLSSADHLEKLLKHSQFQGVNPAIMDCAEELIKYIRTPGGVIDNNQHGILGYSDDAYFIHSLISALQAEGVINTHSWNINWIRINAGAEVVFNMVGNHIRNILDTNIAAYCHQLVQKYNPQAGQQPAAYQQQLDDLQKAKDDVWKAKLMSLETAMIQNPVW